MGDNTHRACEHTLFPLERVASVEVKQRDWTTLAHASVAKLVENSVKAAVVSDLPAPEKQLWGNGVQADKATSPGRENALAVRGISDA